MLVGRVVASCLLRKEKRRGLGEEEESKRWAQKRPCRLGGRGLGLLGHLLGEEGRAGCQFKVHTGGRSVSLGCKKNNRSVSTSPSSPLPNHHTLHSPPTSGAT